MKPVPYLRPCAADEQVSATNRDEQGHSAKNLLASDLLDW
jgi:hypothetical protein